MSGPAKPLVYEYFFNVYQTQASKAPPAGLYLHPTKAGADSHARQSPYQRRGCVTVRLFANGTVEAEVIA